jgi:hypothetical protein
MTTFIPAGTPPINYLEPGYAANYDYLEKWSKRRGGANCEHSQAKCYAGCSNQKKHFAPGAHEKRKKKLKPHLIMIRTEVP